MRKKVDHILSSKYGWLILIIALVVVNYLASVFHARLDLTSEKRYTLSKETKAILETLENDVQIDVFLKGEFPSGFRKLANSTDEFLRLLKERNSSKIRYRFVSPSDLIPGANRSYGDTLVSMGAIPINLTVQKKEGESTNIIFPVALITIDGKQSLVNLLPGANRQMSQQELNTAEALMEYQFVKTLDKMTSKETPAIVYATGNGEPTDFRVMDMEQTLTKEYRFGPFDISSNPIPVEADVLMIVKPTSQFSDDEKLKIDQFVMRGGKLLCFIDNLYAERDSLAYKPETVAYDRNLNLTDLFFRYGFRINTDLVMDLQCDVIPFIVGGTADNPQMELLRWNYYPFLTPTTNQITRGLGYINARFANSIDTIKADGVNKETLLVTSPNSRIISTPALISLNENRNVPEDEKFKKNAIPVAMLLEGKFTSLYRNRISTSQKDTLAAQGVTFKDVSPDNKMIVVADGDMVLNDIIAPDGPGSVPEPIPMGWNKYTYSEYLQQTERGKWFIPVANREFLLNCIEYLVSNPGISEIRNKDIVLRLLDSKKVNAQKSTWQFVNIVSPIILIVLLGGVYQQVRKKKYSS